MDDEVLVVGLRTAEVDLSTEIERSRLFTLHSI